MNRDFRKFIPHLLLPVLLCVLVNIGSTAGASSPLQQSSEADPSQAFLMVDGVSEPKLGPGDLLKITVWNGREVQEADVRVSDDGTAFVGFGVDRNVNVGNLTSTQVKGIVQRELEKYFREAIVQVVIEEYNSNRAYLIGAIGGRQGGGAGLFPLKGQKNVLEFITEHGGFAERANISRVQVNRTDGEVVQVNLSDVIFRGDEAQNVIVNPGDIVWVPSLEVGANTYYVFGEVRSPGLVVAQEDLSLVEVLSRAGSFTPDADQDSVYVARGEVDQPEIHQMDVKKLIEEADFSQNVRLQSEDVIYVPRRKLGKYRDVIAAVAPLLGLLRDSVFLWRVR